MSDHSVHLDRVLELVGMICDDRASQDDFSELDSIMLADREAFNSYLGYCRMHSALRWDLRAHRATDAVLDQIRIRPTTVSSSGAEGVTRAKSPAVSPPAFFRTTLGYFSEGMPLAYLLAIIIFGVGLLIGSQIYVSGPEQVARDLSPATKDRATRNSQMPFVGRITGMVDCEWADESTAAANGAHVCLGRKYALSSGLMEITYDTGAKVTLQGPVSYEVESKNGGFICVGKLTGRVEVEQAKGFVVRTPAATVTDLGTEFGVQVLEDGQTELHVLQGSVEAAFGDAEGIGHQRIKVAAGEAVRLNRGRLAFDRLDARPSSFVRTIVRPATALPKLMVADAFVYPDGPLDGNNGGSAGVGSYWSGAWFRPGTVSDHRAVLPESQVVSRAFHPSRAGSPTQPIYFSARFTKTGPTAKYAANVELVANLSDGNDTFDEATIGLCNDHYRVFVGGGSLAESRYENFGDYTPGQQVLIVGKLEFNVDGAKDRLRAWVNPTGEETSQVTSPEMVADLGWTTPRCVHLRNWTGPTGTCFVTDLRIGYTWDAVAGPSSIPASKEDQSMQQ